MGGGHLQGGTPRVSWRPEVRVGPGLSCWVGPGSCTAGRVLGQTLWAGLAATRAAQEVMSGWLRAPRRSEA